MHQKRRPPEIPITHDPDLNDPESLNQLRRAWVEAIDELSEQGGGQIVLTVTDAGAARNSEWLKLGLEYAAERGVKVFLSETAQTTKRQ